MDEHAEDIERAAQAVGEAEAILIGAGAGMGVDSGMPDFRGTEGFWKAYPAFKGRDFSEMSNPAWFDNDPQLAWGFFGHRHSLYCKTPPHDGFTILRRWAARMPRGAAVFTSNVDGHFQKAGFDSRQVTECHGSIHYLQCSALCTQSIWPAYGLRVDVDLETVRAVSPLPTCRNCGAVARPNILMFGDYDWLSARSDAQYGRHQTFTQSLSGHRVVVIELGAGTAIPTVRSVCERLRGATLIRINPRDPDAPEGAVSLPLRAADALRRIQDRLDARLGNSW